MDITVEKTKLYEKDPQAWVRGLQKFLYEGILALVEADPNRRMKLVSEEAMKVWVKAFTHSSENPNTDENYEVLEFLGDQTMAACLAKYLIKRFRGINQAQLSSFKSHFLDKVRLAEISNKFGLDNWVRSNEENNINIQEDLMESVFGAVVEIADNQISQGLGSIYCFNLVVKLFNKIKADYSLFLGMPKTQVKEIFEKLGWADVGSKPPEEAVKLDSQNYEITVYLSPEGIQWLQERGINLKSLPNMELNQKGQGKAFTKAYDSIISKLQEAGLGKNAIKTLNKQINVPKTQSKTIVKVLGRANGSKKAATAEAYEIALNRLESFGISWERANEIKNQLDFQRPELAPYITSLNTKIQELGLSGVYFPKTDVVKEKGKEAKYIKLIGINSDGRKVILSIIKGNKTDDDSNLRTAAIVSFLKKHYK